MNVDRLIAVRQWILDNPGRLDMNGWRTCVAGVAVRLFDPDFYASGAFGIEHRASELLQIPYSLEPHLFDHFPTDEESDKYCTSFTNDAMIVARLTALIESS